MSGVSSTSVGKGLRAKVIEIDPPPSAVTWS